MNWAERFYYCVTSPSCLRWAVEVRCGADYCRVSVSPGDVVGCPDGAGYFVTKWDGVSALCHRIVYEMFFGPVPDGLVIDHIDGTKRNVIENLRAVPSCVNSRNSHMYTTNKSGATGVCFVNNKAWRASWSEDGKLTTKQFSVRELGDRVAFEMALARRAKAIEDMNKRGSGYLPRHGQQKE